MLQSHGSAVDLHRAATDYFGIFHSWMDKQADFVIRGRESSRLAANAVIPEFRYRSTGFFRLLYDTDFILNPENQSSPQ